MTRHAMFDSAYPPSDSMSIQETIESDISMKLCHGQTYEQILGRYNELIDLEPWQEQKSRLNPRPERIEDYIKLVSDEYRRLVPESSAHVKSIYDVGWFLEEAGIAWSFDEGFDQSEAAYYAQRKARAYDSNDYACCTIQDVDRLISTGVLYVGFSSMIASKEEHEKTGRWVYNELTERGLNPEWDGDASARIKCSNLLYEVKLAPDFP
ncbi:hypothetical protein [Brevibacterium sp. HMSC07C04]|uniref:DUF6891 domain-containing protein n=1 Tax=Brevibacterium sp. HMSC07C04 TaxID=1581130 RepID=UPI0008A138C3|nr:hypothetical protein [Brevibacterium sp. HMSC07C04]